MTPGLLRAFRTATVGALATLGLLAIGTRPAKAAKLNPDCYNTNPALCEQVEKCSGGFEPNGTCKWIYTVTRYYWRN